MLLIKKESSWRFVTSGSAGLGVGFVAVQGGTISLRDPSGTPTSFRYASAGGGLTGGFKVPKFGKIQLPKLKGEEVGGVLAPETFPNAGKLYVLDTFNGDDFARSDISGVCMFAEIEASLAVGLSGIAMVFGMDPCLFAFATISPIWPVLAETELIQSATGILLMGGMNVGYQAGYGGALFVGALW